ncbi:PROTEIN PHOSPHATASE RELATED [Salix koriyanagi]|uniref:PROTEIN PHOSPHATASE RELATED n=1 Tax=Salix koriyanagi TaxID=2511006 RepID=A0A9Q0W929_9ROSI|nr:PROTEIN PHOSPHATASE RELATED [Salix koriyanagi]
MDHQAQDDDNHLHQELQNQLDLKEEFPNSNDSHEEEAEEEEEEEEELKSEESDKRSKVFHEAESIEKVGDDGDDLENANERGNDYANNSSSRSHQYPVRPDADDCAFYMKTGTCKFEANCKFNHPLRRRNQTVKDKVKEREEATERPSLTECKAFAPFSQNIL